MTGAGVLPLLARVVGLGLVGLGGWDFYHHVQRLQPHDMLTGVVLVLGASLAFPDQTRRALRASGRYLLRKP